MSDQDRANATTSRRRCRRLSLRRRQQDRCAFAPLGRRLPPLLLLLILLILGGGSYCPAEGFLVRGDGRSEDQSPSLPRRASAAPTSRRGAVGGAAAGAASAAEAAASSHKNPLLHALNHHGNHAKAHPQQYGTHQIGSHTLQTTLAGRIWPVLSKLLHAFRPSRLRAAASSVLEVANWQGVVFLLLVAYGTVPFTRMVWERSELGRHLRAGGGQEGVEVVEVEGDEAPPPSSLPTWGELKRRHAAEVASGLARVALAVYGVDVLCVALTSLGFAFPSRWQVPTVFSKVAYAAWGLRTFLRFKTAALCRIFNVAPQAVQSGRLDLLNRTLTAVSVGLVSLLLLDWLSIRMGVALKGLLTLGSVGTLAFSLASKDLVSQFISGVFLSASSKVYAGDSVLFGDGTGGTVVKLGLVDTVLRQGDNSLTSVPNAKLANQKVSNLSRVQVSQVAQTLRFHYEDADEIPALVETIKREIRGACPRLIVDGTRPFRVFWTGFKEDHLEVMVDAHFMIPPIGDAYWINRQRVLMAINRAVKDHGLEFAKLRRVDPGAQQPGWRVVDPAPGRKEEAAAAAVDADALPERRKKAAASAASEDPGHAAAPASAGEAAPQAEEKVGA